MNRDTDVPYPRISVVVPSCDRPEMLRRAVASLLAQSLTAHEIIVVDNGAVAVSPRSLDGRVKLIRTAPRIGVAAARNIGARASSGKYIAFLDDDDTWNASYLERMSVSIASSPDAVHVATIENIDHLGVPMGLRRFPTDPARWRMVYLRNPHFGGSNFVVPRTLFFQVGGFDEAFRATEDRDLFATMLESGVAFESVPDAVAVAWHHTGPRSHDQHLSGNIRFYIKHFLHLTIPEHCLSLSRLGRRALRQYIHSLRLRLSGGRQ